MPTVSISKAFDFAASHFLTDYHGKCEHLHGHNYTLHVTVSGPVQKNGLVIDFLHVKSIVKEKVLEPLDHTHLNEKFPNPSAEHIIVWIWEQLLSPFEERGVKLTKLQVWETPDSWVTYEGK